MGLYWDYYLGLDLGQANDYTAIAVIEEPTWCGPVNAQKLYMEPGWVAPASLSPWARATIRRSPEPLPERPTLAVRHLERIRGKPYPAIVDRVVKLIERKPLVGMTALVVDGTGVGRPVLDLLIQAGLSPIAVTIHGGSAVSASPGGLELGVPKRDLVAAAQVVLQNGKLRVAEALAEADTLTRELLAFKVKIAANAHDSYGNDWRENPHDDLVLATALAVWYRQWVCEHLDMGMVAGTWRDSTAGPAESRIERTERG